MTPFPETVSELIFLFVRHFDVVNQWTHAWQHGISSRWWNIIVRMSVVLNRTVVDSQYWRHLMVFNSGYWPDWSIKIGQVTMLLVVCQLTNISNGHPTVFRDYGCFHWLRWTSQRVFCGCTVQCERSTFWGSLCFLRCLSSSIMYKIKCSDCRGPFLLVRPAET